MSPWASTTATWRTADCGSAPINWASAGCAAVPARSSSSARGPYAGSTNDWVATAPTPASAQVTTEPTENQCDCTATPSSPVAGSRATIEKVCTAVSYTHLRAHETPEHLVC